MGRPDSRELAEAIASQLRRAAELCGYQLVPLRTVQPDTANVSAPAEPLQQSADGCVHARRLMTAKAWARASAIRTRALGGALAADPAWDMLLHLYVAYREGGALSVSSTCHSSCVPSTTALRWVTLLEKEGWLSQYPHADDRRMSLLRLTDDALLKIEKALDVVVDSDRRLGLERMAIRQ